MNTSRDRFMYAIETIVCNIMFVAPLVWLVYNVSTADALPYVYSINMRQI